MNNITFSVRLPMQDYQAFKALCESEGTTPSEVIRTNISQMVLRKKLPITRRSLENYLASGELPPGTQNSLTLLKASFADLPPKESPDETDFWDELINSETWENPEVVR